MDLVEQLKILQDFCALKGKTAGSAKKNKNKKKGVRVGKLFFFFFVFLKIGSMTMASGDLRCTYVPRTHELTMGLFMSILIQFSHQDLRGLKTQQLHFNSTPVLWQPHPAPEESKSLTHSSRMRTTSVLFS